MSVCTNVHSLFACRGGEGKAQVNDEERGERDAGERRTAERRGRGGRRRASRRGGEGRRRASRRRRGGKGERIPSRGHDKTSPEGGAQLLIARGPASLPLRTPADLRGVVGRRHRHLHFLCFLFPEARPKFVHMDGEWTRIRGLPDAVVHRAAACLHDERSRVHLLPFRRATLITTRSIVPNLRPRGKFSRTHTQVISTLLALRSHSQMLSYQAVRGLHALSKTLHITRVCACARISARGSAVD